MAGTDVNILKGFFTLHDSSHGSFQEFSENSRVEPGRVRGSVRELTGRMESGPEVFQLSRVGSGEVVLTRSNPREEMRRRSDP